MENFTPSQPWQNRRQMEHFSPLLAAVPPLFRLRLPRVKRNQLYAKWIGIRLRARLWRRKFRRPLKYKLIVRFCSGLTFHRPLVETLPSAPPCKLPTATRLYPSVEISDSLAIKGKLP